MPENCVIEYLGYPENDDCWLYYEGECKIFSGIKYKSICEDEVKHNWLFDSYWVMEDEQIMSKRIEKAFKSQGFQVFDIEIYSANQWTGQYTSIVRCTYNKPMPKNNVFTINGLKENHCDETPLQFRFTST